MNLGVIQFLTTKADKKVVEDMKAFP